MRFLSTSFLTSTQILVLALGTGLSVLSAQDLPTPTDVWTGGSGTNDNWQSNNDNWVGNAPIGGSNSTVLGFGAADQYTSENLTAQFQLRNLIFAEDAEAYVISGESLRFHGALGTAATRNILYNRSQYLQTIQNDLYLTANMTFDTGAAGLLWSGNVTSEAGAGTYTVTKRGLGDLIVTGDHTGADKNIAWTLILGTLVMDASSPSFESDSFESNIHLSGGNLRVVGANSGPVTVVSLGALTHALGYAGQIFVDSNGGAGTDLVFSSWGDSVNMSTVNFYLADDAARVRVTGALPGNNANYYKDITVGEVTTRLWNYATITTTEIVGLDSVRRTGFVAVDEQGYLNRYDVFTDLPASGSAGNTNYRTSGELTLTADSGTVHFLTIQSAGEMKGDYRLGVIGSILMEEGVGDYTFSVQRLGSGSAGNRVYIFQYSMDGDLIINSQIGSAGNHYNNNTLVKSGPGKVIVESSNPTLMGSATASISILEGWLQLDGRFEAAFGVQVRGGLSGKGSIGGGDEWNTGTTPAPSLGVRYTPVTIYAGGTIDASNVGQKALDITGSLTLNAESTYHMTLAETRGAALSVTRDPSLAPEVASTFLTGDLSLDLTFAPTLNEWIVLLTTNGAISGEFLTINGNSFSGINGDEFSLLYNSQDYGFRIAYDHDLGGGITAVAIQVQAIPEPATVAVLVAIGLAGMIVLRRRSKTIA